MNAEEIEVAICNLVHHSLENKKYSGEFIFGISEGTIDIAWKHYFIDLKKYSFKIHSDDIRHIYNEHREEVYHICKIHYYLERFQKIEKTTTRDRQTGKNIPCLTFTKQLKEKKVKIVKLNIRKAKILSLKTLYEV